MVIAWGAFRILAHPKIHIDHGAGAKVREQLKSLYIGHIKDSNNKAIQPDVGDKIKLAVEPPKPPKDEQPPAQPAKQRKSAGTSPDEGADAPKLRLQQRQTRRKGEGRQARAAAWCQMAHGICKQVMVSHM